MTLCSSADARYAISVPDQFRLSAPRKRALRPPHGSGTAVHGGLVLERAGRRGQSSRRGAKSFAHHRRRSPLAAGGSPSGRDTGGIGAFLERLGLELPVVQAGMGGGLAGHELAAAVSAAGGLGTIGILGADDLRREIAAARRLTDRPLAVNLLLPFARRAHFEAASEADVVVTFWGSAEAPHLQGLDPPVRLGRGGAGGPRGRADAVIVQGVEAGGHVRGTAPALELLARVRAALRATTRCSRPAASPTAPTSGPASTPGRRRSSAAPASSSPRRAVAHPDVQGAVARGAARRSSPSCSAPAGRRRTASFRTRPPLAGCERDQRGPGWLRAFHRATAPIFSRVPVPMQFRLAADADAG